MDDFTEIDDTYLGGAVFGARGDMSDLSPEARRAVRQGRAGQAKADRADAKAARQAQAQAAREGRSAQQAATQAERAEQARVRKANRQASGGGGGEDVMNTLRSLTNSGSDAADAGDDSEGQTALKTAASSASSITSDPGGTLDTGKGVATDLIKKNTGLDLSFLPSLRITKGSSYIDPKKFTSKKLKRVAAAATKKAPAVPWTSKQYVAPVKMMRDQLIAAKRGMEAIAAFPLNDAQKARLARYGRYWQQAASGLMMDSHNPKTNKEAQLGGFVLGFGGLHIYPVTLSGIKYTAWNCAFASVGGADYAKRLNGLVSVWLGQLRAKPAPSAPSAPKVAPQSSPQALTDARERRVTPQASMSGGGGGAIALLAVAVTAVGVIAAKRMK